MDGTILEVNGLQGTWMLNIITAVLILTGCLIVPDTAGNFGPPHEIVQESPVRPVMPADDAETSRCLERLSRFMEAWSERDYGGMLDFSDPLCEPLKKYDGDDARREMFRLFGLASPTDYTVEYMDEDNGSDVRLLCLSIDKKFYDERVDTVHIEVRMVRVAGEWYVDPMSFFAVQ